MKTRLLLVLILLFTYNISYSQNYTNDTFQSNWLEYNFGEVIVGDSCSCVLTLKNITAETLTVEYLITSCNCVSASINKKKIKPGKTAIVSIRFNSNGKSLGTIEQSIYVGLDKKRIYNFKVTATLIEQLAN